MLPERGMRNNAKTVERAREALAVAADYTIGRAFSRLIHEKTTAS